MSTDNQMTTLTRVREAQDALDKAKAAMDRVQTGLSAVESVAEKAESARRHPVRTSALFLLIAGVVLSAVFGIKAIADD